MDNIFLYFSRSSERRVLELWRKLTWPKEMELAIQRGEGELYTRRRRVASCAKRKSKNGGGAWKWARKLTSGAGAASDPNEIDSGKQNPRPRAEEGRQVRHCIPPRHLHVTLISPPLLPNSRQPSPHHKHRGTSWKFREPSYASQYQRFLHDLCIFSLSLF